MSNDHEAVALAFMKRASRDTFKVCADLADDMATKAESGELRVDAQTALRLLATMLRGSAGRP